MHGCLCLAGCESFVETLGSKLRERECVCVCVYALFMFTLCVCMCVCVFQLLVVCVCVCESHYVIHTMHTIYVIHFVGSCSERTYPDHYVTVPPTTTFPYERST